ncbi:MAG: hypothetical protein KF722_04770 [Nitrospira sp.]|nr:hypothetical protein [Nitrospira sp.]
MRQTFMRRKAGVVAAAFAAIIGSGGFAPAGAYTFDSGDLVLAIYGNDTEYYRNLGPAASLLADGANNTVDLNLSSLNPLTAVGGPEPVQWALVRNTFGPGISAAQTFNNYASKLTAQEILDSGNNYSVAQANGAITSWQSNIAAVPGLPAGNEVLLPKTDPGSFTTQMGIGGMLNGSFPSILEGELGTFMTILEGTVRGNVLSDVGRALLEADGRLQVCGGAGCTVEPIPIPAAAVLFATGITALIGLARRQPNGEGTAG